MTTTDSHLRITNPSIIAFYESNKEFNFEQVNLWLLELLQQISSTTNWQTQLKSKIEGAIADSVSEDDQKIKELKHFQTRLRDTVHQAALRIMTEFGVLKESYIQEFRSTVDSSSSSFSQQETNNTFMERLRFLFAEILRLRVNGIADKTTQMMRQFQSILNTNVQSFSSQMINEYVQNFDTNAGSMINAVLQLLTDYMAQKETQIVSLLDGLKKRNVKETATYYKVIYELNDVLHQLEKDDSVHKQHNFESVLAQMFPTASITVDMESTAQPTSLTRYVVLREDGTVPILVESHMLVDRNVGVEEARTFSKKVNEKMAHGIIVSQFTGITGKPNYHLEIQHNRIVVYLHKADFSIEKVQHAVDMINTLSNKLSELCLFSDNKYVIPREVQDDINREYQNFIEQKESIVGFVKDQHKKLLFQLEEMRFASLDKFLSTRYSTCKKQGFLCDLCNVFSVHTLKGLAAHKRGCLRKQNNNATTTVFVKDTKPCDF